MSRTPNDFGSKRISISLNEAEAVAVKAALFEYAHKLSPGLRKERAHALAKRMKSALRVFE